MHERDNFFIGGRWETPASSERLPVRSPSTEEVIGHVPAATTEDIDAAVDAARRAFDGGPWPSMTVADRAEFLFDVVERFTTRVPEAIETQIDEMGGTRQFHTPIMTAVMPFAKRMVSDSEMVKLQEIRDGMRGNVLVLREPIGVTAGIIPWNAPIMSAFSKLLPSLLMGCPMVLKPAPESPLSAYLLAEAIEEVGLPKGVVSVVAGGREVGEHLVAHPGVDKVTFTGSSTAGQRIAVVCAEQLKPVTLELGGKSAAIILPGVDMSVHLPTLVGNSLRNSGQMCIATTRILVHETQHDNFVEQLAEFVSELKVGDPHGADTVFGPLVAERQRDRVESYIRIGREEGAKVVLGGGRPSWLDKGWYVEPTIFVDVDRDMTIAQEEIFGPVLAILRYRSIDDAVAIANDSVYGLGGAVFSDDLDAALKVARRLQTGSCTINDAPPTGGGGPFGGYKRSGLGRERGPEGLLSFLETKSITLPLGYEPAHF